MTKFQAVSERILACLALLFLAAYAIPILEPDIDSGFERLCNVVVVVVWVAFGVHYLVSLVLAEERVTWFWHHLLDLFILIVPFLRPLRLLQLVLLLRVMNASGARNLRGRVGLYVGLGSAMLAFVAGLAVLDAERDAPGATITTFGDAMWWSATTMTTVGYGDLFPVTGTGRLVAVGLMVGGIALLGTVTASVAAWLIEAVAEETEAAEQAAEQATEESRVRDLQRVLEEVQTLRAELAASRQSPGDRGTMTT